MFDLSLAELVKAKPVTTMPAEVWADLIRERIDEEGELRAEVERLREEIADVSDNSEELKKITAALRELVAAIDDSSVGKIVKIGSLVIVEGRGELGKSPQLAEALERARELI